jgi:predicted nuclease of predicted toxin-antitoxin system
VRILVDMNLSPQWVGSLAAAGIDAVHWSSEGSPNAPDIELIRHAAENDFIILTQDLDFGAILAASTDHKPSVIQIRAGNTSPDHICADIVRALRQVASELAQGALVTIEPGRRRMTLLPLHES